MLCRCCLLATGWWRKLVIIWEPYKTTIQSLFILIPPRMAASEMTPWPHPIMKCLRQSHVRAYLATNPTAIFFSALCSYFGMRQETVTETVRKTRRPRFCFGVYRRRRTFHKTTTTTCHSKPQGVKAIWSKRVLCLFFFLFPSMPFWCPVLC